MASLACQARGGIPLVLSVPGLNNSAPEHCQSRWEQQRHDCLRVDLGMWENPHRNTWVNRLNLAICRADRPVILVAHGLGCLAVAWWAEYERPQRGNPVIGALLVAPPDVDRVGVDERLARFAPTPELELPFAAFVVANRSDPYVDFARAGALAKAWSARFFHGGCPDGHSRSGDWDVVDALVDDLILQHYATSRKAAEASVQPTPTVSAFGSPPPTMPVFMPAQSPKLRARS